MGITLKQLTSDLRDLRIEDINVPNVLFNGVQLLLEYADSPWDEMIQGICPPAHTFVDLMKAIKLEKQDSDLDVYIVLIIQQAYLEVFQATLNEAKGVLEARFDLDDVDIDKQWHRMLSRSIEEFEQCDIDAVRIDFPNLHDEPLVKDHLEQLTADWLRMRLFRKEHEEREAVTFARRISYQLYPHLLWMIAEHGELCAPLPEYFDVVNHRELQKLEAIEKYRAFLMKLPAKPVLHETFALQDLYVELDAADMTRPSTRRSLIESAIEGSKHFEEGKTAQLMQTVLKQLDNNNDIILIQAEPGRGKSVFCQMLAARVAAERLDWIPVFIPLRDERFVVQDSIEESIREYIRPHFMLTDDLLKTRRFLFILDGLDDLWLSPESGQTLKYFFNQLARFQNTYTEEDGWGHKFIITTDPVRIRYLESELPSKLFRLRIKNMETHRLDMWLRNWAALFGEDTANAFKRVLERGKIFDWSGSIGQDGIKKLVGEPLSLYMLGAMYRDGALPEDILDTSLRRIEIYNRVVSWVCGDTRKYQAVYQSNRILKKSDVTPHQFRQLLQEIALGIWHGGRQFVPVTRITRRLSDSVLEQMKKLMDSGFEGVYNLLISFPFLQYEGDTGNVEFSHKSFGEYLTAERMVEALMQIGERIPNRYSQQEEYRISSMKEVAYRFYSVFGIALLTDEIRDFVMDMLIKNLTIEEMRQMTERLYRVYINYSDGHWMDDGIAKMLWDELKQYGEGAGLLQFEAQAGINLFVLLCLLYRHTDDTFEICGREDDGTFDPNRFRKLVGFGELAGTFGLLRRVHDFLRKVNLHRADLLCANLRRAIMQEANLQGAILREAILREANLQRANLQGVDLRVANLQDANLQEANLQGANLEEADLRDANLQGANLQGANLLCADLRDVDLRGAGLQKVVLYGANLRGALLRDADVTNAVISKQHLVQFRDLFSDEQVAQLKVVQD